MKKFIILWVFCISIFGFGQDISLIRKQVEDINKSKNLIVKKIPNDYFTDVKREVTDNGQEIEAYYNNNELKKIVHSVGLSNSEISTQLYYDKKKLIFVLRKKYQTIDEKGNLREPRLISESRFYFNNGKIIQPKNPNSVEIAELLKQSLNFQEDLKNYK
ncbi:hypothetical protein [Epilithonimonas sp.]|uniref:hypothetical protein n=1 Tax=Epilithonimonas sp. TaxID=2894511 RepID=UPI002FDDC5B7